MPYDPRQMLQLGQYGLGMLGPQQGNPVANQSAQSRPKQWWEQPVPGRNQPDAQADQPTGQSANQSAKQPPSLYDMMLNLGKMTRPQYDKAISGPGAYGISPQTAAHAGPWAFLGSLGLPGGPGWGGSQGGTG